MSKEKGLSIIIPIYNVENYLKQCIESVLHQRTNRRYEVLLINDGSTDYSGEVCKKYMELYPCLKYYEKENEGLGPTRNLGIKYAQYSYVTFLDSDDWVDEHFVEYMMKMVEEQNADITYCDCVYFHENIQQYTKAFFRSNLQKINADYQTRMSFGYPNMWGAVYRKDLWIKNGIEMPGIYYEDTAVYPVLLAFANRIVCCPHNLYFYRCGRSGSIMQIGTKDYRYMLRALDFLVGLAREKGVFMTHQIEIMDFCFRQLVGEWERCIWNKCDLELLDIKNDISNFMHQNFAKWENAYGQSIVSIGSYNSSAVYNRIKLFRERLGDKYQFASFLSIMSPCVKKEELFWNENASMFRRDSLEKEKCEDVLKTIGNNRVIILDFLNEIYDILFIQNTCFIESEAVVESMDLSKTEYIRIKRNSAEAFELWKKSCMRFCEWCEDKQNKIILMKLFFCETYGNESEKKSFACIETIRNQNQMLERYYNYIEEICPNIKIVSIDKRLMYTDSDFKFGCEPRYYNEFMYYLLANETLRCIREY